MLTGEKPEVNPEVAARLAEYGHDDVVLLWSWACERALDGGCSRTPTWRCTRDELERLRQVTALRA